MTVRSDIRDQVIAELNADLPTGVPEASRRRYVPGTKLDAARIAVFFVEEPVSRPGSRAMPIVQRKLTVAVQCVLPVEDPEDADDAMESLLEHVVARLGDTYLGGLATDMRELGTQWAGDSSTGLYVFMALTRWEVEYQTQRADLTKKQ